MFFIIWSILGVVGLCMEKWAKRQSNFTRTNRRIERVGNFLAWFSPLGILLFVVYFFGMK